MDAGADGGVADVSPPTWPPGAQLVASAITLSSFTLAWPAARDDSGVTAYRLQCSGAPALQLGPVTQAALVGLAPATGYRCAVQAGDAAGNWSSDGPSLTARTNPVTPPPTDPSVATSLAEGASFLFSCPPESPGCNLAQSGVDASVMDRKRLAVLQGTVTDRGGTPLAGVEVSVLAHREFGRVLSQGDGSFELATNGGGDLVVTFSKPGFLAAQRAVRTRWQGYAPLPPIALTEAGDSSAIDLRERDQWHFARGTVAQASSAHARQPTLFFPPGVQVIVGAGGGTTRPSQVHVHVAEHTVADGDLAAMPAQLPPASGYTHAVTFSLDEAGPDDSVSFADAAGNPTPLLYYVENFLGFPVGANVPTGYYDKGRGAWVPSANGRIIRVLTTRNAQGLVSLDVDGTPAGSSEAAIAQLGISPGERTLLGQLYGGNAAAAPSLWRSQLFHFSAWDTNWGINPPPDAVPPSVTPHPHKPDKTPCDKTGTASSRGGGKGAGGDGSQGTGTIGGSFDPAGSKTRPTVGISCDDLTVHEAVAIEHTALALTYSSDRVPGRLAEKTLTIPLGDGPLPKSLSAIGVDVQIAGEHLTQSFPPAAGQSFDFVWDGNDAFGRPLQGAYPVDLRVQYDYPGSYQAVPKFGDNGNGVTITGDPARNLISFPQFWSGVLGHWDARADGLAGWSLNVHHSYDPSSSVVHLGTGIDLEVGTRARSAATLVAGGSAYTLDQENVPALGAELLFPQQVVVAEEGVIYLLDHGRVRQIGSDGNISTVAGALQNGVDLDGVDARAANLLGAMSIALGPGGVIYIADPRTSRVRRVRNGVIDTLAGGGTLSSGDEGPATNASLYMPMGVSVAPDGSVYVLEIGRTRLVRLDGTITTVVGTGPADGGIPGGDGSPARGSYLIASSLSACGDGTLLLADSSGAIFRVTTDGRLWHIGGSEVDTDPSEGVALHSNIHPQHIRCLPGGAALFVDGPDTGGNRIKVLEGGSIRTIAGGENGIALISTLPGSSPPVSAVSALAADVGPDGALYFSWPGQAAASARIFRAATAYPGFSNQGIDVASADGARLFHFDGRGKHLSTTNVLDGVRLFSFAYDPQGRLAAVTDVDDAVTRIDRSQNGALTVIAPDGGRTVISLDGNGWPSSIRTASGRASATVRHDAGGLLLKLSRASGASAFQYDAEGLLARQTQSGGPTVRYDHQPLPGDGYTVTMTTGMGEVSSHRLEHLPNGTMRETATSVIGVSTTATRAPDGKTVIAASDQSMLVQTLGPDPRFGMQAPLLASVQIAMPDAGPMLQASEMRAVVGDADGGVTFTESLTVNGKSAATTYDAVARTRTTLSAAGRKVVDGYDAKGRLISRTVPGFFPFAVGYDAAGRLSSIVQANPAHADTDSRKLLFGYDGSGNLSSVTAGGVSVSTSAVDAAGNVVRTLPGGRRLAEVVDDAGRIVSIAPPSRPAHTYVYDDVGIQQYLPPPVDGADAGVTYRRDLDGRIIGMQTASGDQVTVAYDGGVLASVTSTAGTTTFALDSQTGALAGIANGDAQIALQHSGPLLTRADFSGPVQARYSFHYDNSFRVDSEMLSSDGGQSIARSYDDDGLLADAGSLAIARSNALGKPSALQIGQSLETRQYDGYGEMSDQAEAFAGRTDFHQHFSFDALGRVTVVQEDDPARSRQYAHDAAGRLTDVRGADNTLLAHYDYDANGNRISGPVPGVDVHAQTDAQDRLLRYGDETFTYTPDGALSTRSRGPDRQTLGYDSLGNLRSVTFSSNGAVTKRIVYLVDGLNRRVAKKVDGNLSEAFVYRDAQSIGAWFGPGGALLAQFVYASRANVPDAMIKSGATFRIVTDARGSVRRVIDVVSGSVAQSIDYDEFGNVIADTNPGFQPFGYAGGLWDRDTGLVRLGARDYDPRLGRWTSKDPLLFGSAGTNLYLYAFGDPINFVDATGREPQKSIEDMGCFELLQEIARVTESLTAHLDEMAADKFNLNPDHYDLSNPLALPDGTKIGSVEGHYARNLGEQQRLRDLMRAYRDDCGDPPMDSQRLAYRTLSMPERKASQSPIDGAAAAKALGATGVVAGVGALLAEGAAYAWVLIFAF